jgi:hypothetical protein
VIGGPITAVGLAALFGEEPDRADQYRPADAAGLRQAARVLRDQGLIDRDIGQALTLTEACVQQLLEGDHDAASCPTTDDA